MEAEVPASAEELLAYVDSLRLARDVMNLMLRGRSVIDSHHGLPIRTVEAADEFLFKYGYNLENPVEAAEVLGNYHEALRFIRRYFLKPDNPDGADLEIPKTFLELGDVRCLFAWAADKSLEEINRTRWACSILRVVHAISHLDKDLRHDFFPEIQKQIFDRFYKEIHTEEGKLFLGDPKLANSVALEKFQTKPRKTRDSVILKLLHKKETLAEDVFDQIGVRFVTKSRIDVVRVLKYLRDRYIVMMMNLRPSRSRNNLVDPMLYRRKWREVRHAVLRGELNNRDAINGLLENSLLEGYDEAQKEIVENNPFSMSTFHSIQFTCRQLIKYRSSVFEEVKNLRALLKNTEDQNVKAVMERLDFTQFAKEQRFFYPFEVQIMDLENFEEAESGRASHAVYKAAQTKMAMHRVLGHLLPQGHAAAEQ
ncbi:MAG: TIGR04552 family protein [Bdellovibrionota bacterium]